MKQTFFINPINIDGAVEDPMSDYWLRRTKNDHAVFCTAATGNQVPHECLVSFSLHTAAQMRCLPSRTGSVSHYLEITMASGSVYELIVSEPETQADVTLTDEISGPCCDDVYPITP